MNKRRWIIMSIVGAVVVVAIVLLALRSGSGDELATDAAETQKRRAAVVVRATPATLGSVQTWVFAEGTARAAKREYLTFQNAGRIAYVAAGPDGSELREGQRVTKGQVLARQDQRQLKADLEVSQASIREARTQLAVAQAQVRQAKAEAELAQRNFERYAKLREQKSSSGQEYDQAKAEADSKQAAVERADSQVEAALAQVTAAESRAVQAAIGLEDAELVAPIDGLVAYKNIEQGQYFAPSRIQTTTETAALQSIPLVLIDTSRFEVTVSVPSFERGRVRVGQPVLLATAGETVSPAVALAAATATQATQPATSPSGRVGPIPGEVFSVNPAVDPGGRSIQVKIRAVDPSERLEDGMFLTAWIATEQRDGVVVAPLDVFVYEDDQPSVFVIAPSTNTVRRRQVTLGLGSFESQQIAAGVEPGELLVTEGRFQLSEGTPVTVLQGEGGQRDEQR